MGDELGQAGSLGLMHIDPVEVEKVEWRRLVALLSPRCTSLDGHEIGFTSVHFTLAGWPDAPLVVGGVKVSLRMNWLHYCFNAYDVPQVPPIRLVRREFSCDCDSNVVQRVLQAIPRCCTLTHARLSFSGYDPLAVERLLFPLCKRLRFTPALRTLHIDISFPLRKQNRLGCDVRRFSPALLVRNRTLKTLLIHSDSHSFDCEAAEHIPLFVRENRVLKSLDLQLVVTSRSRADMGNALWILMRPLSDADRFDYPSQEVFNKTLTTLVLKFIFWNPGCQFPSVRPDVDPLDGIKHRGGDVFVTSSFFMCPFLHKLSLSLVSTNENDATEVIHVAAKTRCRGGYKELHILKCDESFNEDDDIMWPVFNLGTVVWTTFKYANAAVLVLHNPSPAALRHYIPIYRNSYRDPVHTIKVSSYAFRSVRLEALVASILNHEGPELHVEMTHGYLTHILDGKTSEDIMWGLHRDLGDLTCLQSFIFDQWELRRVDGVLRPLLAGAFLCTKSVELTEVYEVRVKMTRGR